MPEHNIITDPDIHEPKGITTASDGSAYIANGTGSGTWIRVPGANAIVVKQASDLSGVLDSTKTYIIDGTVSMGTQEIVVPNSGLNIMGFNRDSSKLTSSEDNYSMFTGGGNLFCSELTITVDGLSSEVFDLSGATGNETLEFGKINWVGCTSLGTINTYAQGLELNTGRFGGTPTLTLDGTWLGGYAAITSVVRFLAVGMTGPIYSAGGTLTMASRFRSNQNIDLPVSASFLDFNPGNFINPSTLQLENCLVTRNGVTDASDTNLTPNIDMTDIASKWSNNVGLPNTHVGGAVQVDSEVVTVISSTNTFEELLGNWATSDLQHFDSPVNGQLRHLGTDPIDYKVTISSILECAANDDISIKIVKFDASVPGFVDISTESRQVNSLSGGRNVAFFTMFATVVLDQNDYVKLQVANATSTSNITAELNSAFFVEARP